MQYEEGHIRRKLAEELVKGLTPEMSVLRGQKTIRCLSSTLPALLSCRVTKMTSALRDALAVARGGLKDDTLKIRTRPQSGWARSCIDFI